MAGSVRKSPTTAETTGSSMDSAAVPNAERLTTSPSEVLSIYGLLMMMIGATAFLAAGDSAKAISAVYAGNGIAALSFICAFSVMYHGKVKKGELRYIFYMIGIHVSICVPLVYAGVCTWRLLLARNVPEKRYVVPYLGANVVLSLACFVFLYSFRPKKGAAKASSLNDPSSETTGTVRDSKSD